MSMKALPIGEARRRLRELVRRVAQGHRTVAIGRNGRPEVMLVPAGAATLAVKRRPLQGLVEIVGKERDLEGSQHSVMVRALLRRDGPAGRDAAEAALASATALIERMGARTLAPALCEWRAELAAVLGDDVTRAQLLRQAQQGYDEIGAPLHAARLKQELGS